MEAAASPHTRWNRAAVIVICLTAIMAGLRLSHIHLLWADEDYHLAAAINILHGKVPYRDFWYDKPPLNAAYYLLIGGYPGWPLRILDTGYILLACYLAYRLALAWWGRSEGWAAALLLAFFTTFYLPSAVIPFGPDALMIAPHLAAMLCAYRKRPFWTGVLAGIAFLLNTKALFILAVCFVWLWPEWPFLLLGFALPAAGGAVWALFAGAWPGYVEQVWRWGWLYARQSPVLNPLQTGFVRTLHWIGFQAALILGAAFAFPRIARSDRMKFAVWLAFSFAAACLGTRFAPHYFLQLLPPLVLLASRGVVLALETRPKQAGVILALALLVPFVRFAPRYVSLAVDDFRGRQPQWSDIALDLDSQHMAEIIRQWAQPGDTLLVWGYRPDVYVYTRMSSDSRFWDSQPLTGVPADRHLSATRAIYGGPAAANREELARSHPTFIVDGLGLLNPKLRPDVYPDLRSWLAQYQPLAQTSLSLIYRRADRLNRR